MAAALAALVLVAVTGSVFVAWQQKSRATELGTAQKRTEKARARAVANEVKAIASAQAAQRHLERAEGQTYLASLARAGSGV